VYSARCITQRASASFQHIPGILSTASRERKPRETSLPPWGASKWREGETCELLDAGPRAGEWSESQGEAVSIGEGRGDSVSSCVESPCSSLCITCQMPGIKCAEGVGETPPTMLILFWMQGQSGIRLPPWWNG
jgi:hypothetical protein